MCWSLLEYSLGEKQEDEIRPQPAISKVQCIAPHARHRNEDTMSTIEAGVKFEVQHPYIWGHTYMGSHIWGHIWGQTRFNRLLDASAAPSTTVQPDDPLTVRDREAAVGVTCRWGSRFSTRHTRQTPPPNPHHCHSRHRAVPPTVSCAILSSLTCP